MTKPTPLPPGASPAAKAVWAAWSNAEIFFDIELTDRCALAAALRAAALYCKRDRLLLLSFAEELDPNSD